MNIVEIQILFQQKIQDVNPVFGFSERPDSFTICNYMNRAIDRYLEKKYLALVSYQQRLIAIDENIDELHLLITPDGDLTAAKNLTEYNWATRGKRYRTPDNILIPISLPCTVTRTEVYPMTDQQVFAEWISRSQAQRLISHTSDKVMYPRPVAVWEDPYYIMLIGDAYTTSLTAGLLTYVRKPYKLDFAYTEYTATGTGNLDITTLAVGSYFLPKARISYVDALGATTIYKPGDKVQKISGYNNITYVDEPVIIGAPWGTTDTPDLAPHVHDSLVEMAVSMFLDESKLKLVQKQN